MSHPRRHLGSVAAVTSIVFTAGLVVFADNVLEEIESTGPTREPVTATEPAETALIEEPEEPIGPSVARNVEVNIKTI